MIQQAADKIAQQVDSQGPASTEITKNSSQIGHAGKHHAPVVDGVVPVHWLIIDAERNITHDRQVKAGANADDIGLEFFA